MKYLLLLVMAGLLFIGTNMLVADLFFGSESYVGKCYTTPSDNAFIASVVVKIDKIRDNGTFNVVIYKTKTPESVEEVLLKAKALSYNNSWADEATLKQLNEVPCD